MDTVILKAVDQVLLFSNRNNKDCLNNSDGDCGGTVATPPATSELYNKASRASPAPSDTPPSTPIDDAAHKATYSLRAALATVAVVPGNKEAPLPTDTSLLDRFVRATRSLKAGHLVTDSAYRSPYHVARVSSLGAPEVRPSHASWEGAIERARVYSQHPRS